MGCGRGWGWGGPYGHHAFPYPYNPYRDDDDYRSHDRHLIREELDRLYATGELNQNEYRHARHRLKHGDFTWGDLRKLSYRSEASAEPTPRPGEPPPTRKPGGTDALSGETFRSVEELRAKKAEVERVENETSELLEKLRGSVARLNDDVVRYESLAKGAAGLDDSQARLYLQRRQTAVEQVAGLEARINELEKDLKRLETLKAVLDAKVLDLTAVGQRERLARLESEIKGLQP